MDLTQDELKDMILNIIDDKSFNISNTGLENLSQELNNYRKELILQNEELMRTNSEIHVLENKYRNLYDNAPIPYFSFNYKGEINSANNAFSYFTGVSSEQLFGRSLLDFLDADCVGLFEFFLDSLSKSDNPYHNYKPLLELSFFIRGQKVDTQLYLSFFNEHGVPTVRAAVADVTEKNRIQRELKEEQQRYRIALESSSEYIFEYDINADVFISYGDFFNSSVSKNETCRRYNFFKEINNGVFCHSHDIFKVEALLHGTSNVFEIRLIPPNGSPDSYVWFSFSASPLYEQNKIVKIFGRARNITAQKQKEEALLRKVYYDGLTGLLAPSRGIYLIDNYLFSCASSARKSALIFIDIRNIHIINVTYGMTFGSAVLALIGDCIASIAQEDSINVRVGGSNFLLLLKNMSHDELYSFAEKLFSAISKVYCGIDTVQSLELSMLLLPDMGELLNKVKKNEAHSVLPLIRVLHSESKTLEKGIYESSASKNMDIFNGIELSENITTFAGVSPLLNTEMSDIMTFAFDILEKTKHTPSAIYILLMRIGMKFGLESIQIYESNSVLFSSNLSYQWGARTSDCRRGFIKKNSPLLLNSMQEIIEAFDENGVLDLSAANHLKFSEKSASCLNQYSDNDVLCCNMYKDGDVNGSILFIGKKTESGWAPESKMQLRRLSKLLATHINRNSSDRSTQAKSEFLSRISHEIRTPINGIIGMLMIMRQFLEADKTDLTSKLVPYLDKVDTSARFLLSTINDVLEMAKIESGKLKLKPEAFTFSTILENIESIFSSSFTEKNLHFSIIRKNTDNLLFGDMLRISQVLINLLSNAIKFTEPGGTITLSCVQEEVRLNHSAFLTYNISVSDTGIGISEENQKIIFNSFEQVYDSSRSNINGTGLGLSISANLVSLMDSKLQLESTVGKGSTFYFKISLPLASNEANRVQKRYEGNGLKNDKNTDFFQGKRILLVEDNEINCEITKVLLESAGFVVETATDGLIALNKFESSATKYYDAIIMDNRMPVMDGLTATRKIRQLKRQDAISTPIVALTADVFNEELKHFSDCGMNGYLTKPVDMNHMLDVLKTLLEA